MDNIFPSRKEIIEKNKSQITSGYQESVINSIKSVNIDKIDFSKGNFKPRTSIIEKQKVYIWIRLFLKEENNNIKPDDTIKMTYLPTGESLDTKFICYSKSTLTKDSKDQIVNYDSEDDKKILCLMVDSEKINYNSENIPILRKLFKVGRYYDYQLLKRDDLEFKNESNGDVLEYFDINF